MQIKNKTIVVTGATRGMGKFFCERIASENVDLILINRKRDEALEKKLKELGAKSVLTYEADLSDLKAIEELGVKLNKHSIDILFNNAGLATGGLLEKQSAAEIQTMLNVNLNALIYLTQVILPQMLERRSGKIINHASLAAVAFLPGLTTYTASKAAVYAFTECLRKELKGTGVSTLALLSPAIRTDMFEQINSYYGDHIKLKLPSYPAKDYIELIYEAIRLDLDVLRPGGLSGAGMRLSQFLPKAFDYILEKSFKR